MYACSFLIPVRRRYEDGYLERYRKIVQEVLQPYTLRKYSGLDVTNEALFDEKTTHYAILSVGWEGKTAPHPSSLLPSGHHQRQSLGVSATAPNTVSRTNWKRRVYQEDIVLAFHRAETAPCCLSTPSLENVSSFVWSNRDAVQ
jgi:hypothetical protein